MVFVLFVAGAWIYSLFAGIQRDNDSHQLQAQAIPEVGTAEEYLVYINAERVKAGVPPLVIDPVLNNTAKIKADDMVAKNYFNHDLPDGSKWETIPRSNGKPDQALGENLAECYRNTEKTVESWITSPSHYHVMINPEYKNYGSFAVLNPTNNCVVVVNHFSS